MTTATTKRDQDYAKTYGHTITDETYIVLYGEHDSGSDSKGLMIREGMDNAKRTMRLLGECGYQRVEVKSAIDMLDA